MRRRRRVKSVATRGPASRGPHLIRHLYEAGADVFRINMSHTDHATLAGYVAAIRDIERDLARPIGILADLQGPKLRLGAMAGGGVTLATGSTVRLALQQGVRRTPHPPLSPPEEFSGPNTGTQT